MSPQKKMKKRKELNALIGGRRKSQSCGHRLLSPAPEPESGSDCSSGDTGGFSGGGGGGGGLCGGRSLQCCSLCYPLCVFVLLAACVMACAGLIWMQIALKEDLDSMKEKIHIMETGQKLSSHEILKLSEELKNKQMKLEELQSGERRVWSNLTDLQLKLSALDSAVSHLKANIKSASDLIALPHTVEELQKSVASIGSTVTSVQHDVSDLQRSGGQQLQNEAKAANSSCESLKQDVQALRDGLSEVNGSLRVHQSWCSEQIQSAHFLLSNLSQWVSVLEQSAATAGPAAARRPRSLAHRLKRRSRSAEEEESGRDSQQLLYRRSPHLSLEDLQQHLSSRAPEPLLTDRHVDTHAEDTQTHSEDTR